MLISIICEKCNEKLDIDVDLSAKEIPNRFDCPLCKAKKSCYRNWKNDISFKIPWNFKATEINDKVPLNFKKRKKHYH